MILFCGNLKKINILIFCFIASFSNSERLVVLRDPVVDSILLQYTECFISNKKMNGVAFFEGKGMGRGSRFSNWKSICIEEERDSVLLEN